MSEIDTADLSAATLARFGDEADAQAAIDAVLVSARRYCKWHVSPVKLGDVVTLNGPGGRVLDLPTRKLNALTEVVEAGTTLDVSKLDWAEDGVHGAPVRKQSNACWSRRYRSIEVTMDHGFTEAEAADWRKAIIDMVDDIALSIPAPTEPSGVLRKKKVDDVEYEWASDQGSATAASLAEKAVDSVSSVLDRYRIPEALFA